MEEKLFNILKLLLSLDTEDKWSTHFFISDNKWIGSFYKTDKDISIALSFDDIHVIDINISIDNDSNIYFNRIKCLPISLDDFNNDIISFTLTNGRTLTKMSRYIISAFFLDYEFLKQTIEEFLSNNEYFRRTIN